jgi:hypothetical protein
MPATEYQCPLCDKVGQESQIMASETAVQCSFNPAHRWADRLEFMSLQPRMAFRVSGPVVAPQMAHTKMTLNVMLPIAHQAAVVAKLGPRLEPTVAGILSMMAEGEVMIVPAADMQRLKQIGIVGKIVNNSSELVGLVYAADLQLTEANDRARRAEAELAEWEGRSRNMVLIDLGEQAEAGRIAASNQNMPLKLFIENAIRNGLANNWF